MKKRFVFKNEILGQLAHWAISQSSYIPDYIPDTLRAAEKYINENPPGEKLIDDMFSYLPDELESYIRVMCHTVPEIKKLNFRKEEIDAGMTDVDADRPRILGIDYDKSWFVDLGALSRNVFASVEKENDWNDASDLRIEKMLAND